MSLPLLFCHGLESAPIGRKSQGLIDLGYAVTAPDCRGKTLAERVEIITQSIVTASKPPVLVGSSFGGIAGLLAAIVAAERGSTIPAMVLCAPALALPPPPGLVDDLRPPCPTTIVHGVRDEIIPVEVSRSFATEFSAQLVEVDDDHHLGATGFEAIVGAVRAVAGSADGFRNP